MTEDKLKDKKIALIMPPTLSYAENFSWLDYPSLIFINNHLRKKGLNPEMIDVHFHFLMKMLSNERIKEDAVKTKQELKALVAKKNFMKESLEYYLRGFHHLNWLKRVDKEIDLTGVKDIYDLSQKNPFLKDSTIYYLISEYDIFKKNHELNNDRNFLEGIDDAFIAKLEEALIEIVKEHKLNEFDFIGITVPSLVHFPYAMLLSRLIKQRGNSTVVLGGPAIILTDDDELKALKADGFFDEYVKLGGEKQFIRIMKEKSGIQIDEEDEGTVNINEQVLKYPTKTQVEKKQAKLSVNFGCYWNKCSFCDFCNLYDKFQIKKVDILIDEIEYLHKEYGINDFMLNTESLVPGYAKKLASKIIDRKLKITWHPIFMRVDNHFTVDIFLLMKKSGCDLHKTSVGVESLCNKALEFLNKPYKREDIINFFEAVRKAGVAFGQLNMITDTPGVTFKESMEGMSILKEYIDAYTDYACTKFHLTSSSPICHGHKQNLITPIYDKEKIDDDYSKRFTFLNHCELYCNKITFKNSIALSSDEMSRLDTEYEKVYDYLQLFMHHPNLDKHKLLDFSERKKLDIDLKMKMFKDMLRLGSKRPHGESESQEETGFIVPKDNFFATGYFVKNYKYIKFLEPGKEYMFSEIIEANIKKKRIMDKKEDVDKLVNFIVHLLSRHYFEKVEIVE